MKPKGPLVIPSEPKGISSSRAVLVLSVSLWYMCRVAASVAAEGPHPTPETEAKSVQRLHHEDS